MQNCSENVNKYILTHYIYWNHQLGWKFSLLVLWSAQTSKCVVRGTVVVLWFYTEKYVHINTCNLTPSPTDAPKNVTLSVRPSGDVTKGDSVTLNCSCSANPPMLNYILYKESGQGSTTVVGWQTHTFSDIQPGDSGWYYCNANNSINTVRSNLTNLNVQCEYWQFNSW